MTEELARKLCEKEIEAKRDFVSKAELLCGIVKKFDGKVLNKRLETAMREIYPVRIEHEKVFDWYSISALIPDRVVFSDVPDKYGHRDCAYIRDDRIYIASCVRDIIDEDGRLIAENLIDRIRDTAKYYAESADQIEEQLGRIDVIKAEFARVRRERNKLVYETKPQIMEYFGLEV